MADPIFVTDGKEETGGHSPLPVNLSYAVQQVFGDINPESAVVLPRCGSEPCQTGLEPEPNHWFGSDSVRFGLPN